MPARPAVRSCLVVIAGLLAACGPRPVDRSPTGVAKQFVVAVQLRETKTVYELLGPATQARLKAAAKRASAQVGGKHKREPHEMLSPAWRPMAVADWTPKTFKLVSKTDTVAKVEVRGDKGQRGVLTLVKVKRRWRVEFDQPALPEPPRPRAVSPPPVRRR